MTQTTGELLDTLRHRKKPDGEYMFPSLWIACIELNDEHACDMGSNCDDYHLVEFPFYRDIDAVGPVLKDLAQAEFDVEITVNGLRQVYKVRMLDQKKSISVVRFDSLDLAEAVFKAAEEITRPEEE